MPQLTQSKENDTMHQFNRTIFTTPRPSIWERIADYALALIIAASLTMGLLCYFDVLTK
jgi:hypothetical protein